MGGLHSLLRFSTLQLPLLFATELAFVLFMVFSLKNMMVLKLKAKMWFVMIFSGLRMVLQLLLFVQQQLKVVSSGTEI